MTFQLALAGAVCSRAAALAVDPEAADPFDPADETRDDFSFPSPFSFFFKHAVIPQPPSSYHPGVLEGPGHVSSGQAEQFVMHMSPHSHPQPPGGIVSKKGDVALLKNKRASVAGASCGPELWRMRV